MDHLNKLQRKVLHEPLWLAYLLGFSKVNTEIHEQWIRSIWQPGDDSMQGHRGSFKTTCNQIAILWGLFFKPNTVIHLLRKTDSEAEETINAVRQFYETDVIRKLYQDGWGIKSVRTNDWSKGNFTLATKTKITKESGVSSGGAVSFKTGSHYDLIIADDIITLADRVSPAKREQTKIVINELHNLKNPSGAIKHTGTPWHPKDGWTICPIPKRYPIGSIQIPDFTPEIIRELRKTTSPSLFAANYLLEHISDEGRLFPDPIYDDFPEGMQIIATLDPGYGGGSHTALALGGMWANMIYVKGYVWDKSVFALYHDILKILKEHKAGTLYVEKNADKGASARDMAKLRGGFVEPYHEPENKHIRIVSSLLKEWERIRWSYETEDDFMNEVSEYQEDQPPNDAPDTAAKLVRILTSRRIKRKPVLRRIL